MGRNFEMESMMKIDKKHKVMMICGNQELMRPKIIDTLPRMKRFWMPLSISMPTFRNLKDMNTVSSANEMKLQFSPKNWGHFPSFLDFPRLWDFQLSSKSHVFQILYIP